MDKIVEVTKAGVITVIGGGDTATVRSPAPKLCYKCLTNVPEDFGIIQVMINGWTSFALLQA